MKRKKDKMKAIKDLKRSGNQNNQTKRKNYPRKRIQKRNNLRVLDLRMKLRVLQKKRMKSVNLKKNLLLR